MGRIFLKAAGDWANSMGKTPVVHLFPLCSAVLCSPCEYVGSQVPSFIDVEDPGILSSLLQASRHCTVSRFVFKRLTLSLINLNCL
jgi:hypothetical protein